VYSATPVVSIATRKTGSAYNYLKVSQSYFVAHGISSTHTTYTSGTPTAANFKDTIIPAALATNPTIVIAGGSPAQLSALLEGWALYAADGAITKPSNFTTLKIFHSGNVAGSDYSTMSLAARTLMRDRVQNLQPYWDDTTESYQRWYTKWTEFYPEKTTPTSPMQMMFFDGNMIMALAVVKANSTAGADIMGAIADVANPPGTVYYPDEFKEARAALMRGEDIDYQGVIVGDFADNFELSTTVPYALYDFDIDGIATVHQVVRY